MLKNWESGKDNVTFSQVGRMMSSVLFWPVKRSDAVIYRKFDLEASFSVMSVGNCVAFSSAPNFHQGSLL